MSLALCVDVGSTFTKAVLVDLARGALVGAASHPTTVGTDVMDGVDAVCRELASHGPVAETLVCSSAGGGLRIAVVGYEREVTAEAGHRVALSAGGRVVHVSSGLLDGTGVRELRGAAPDLVLLVGGTDGGNSDVLRHNAARLASARVTMPIIVAGNAETADEVSQVLTRTGRRHVVTSNVLPRIGVIAPRAARSAIREVFLEHVIGGKGLSRGRGFTELVRAATPDAVLAGVELLADVRGEDVLVIDIGGATTDVYSVLRPQGEDARIERDVAGSLWHERTVEADLGMRWNAPGIVEAADREGLALDDDTRAYAAHVAAVTSHRASTDEEWAHESALARVAAVVAARRHGRARAAGDRQRPLADVGLVLGSGGVFRHGPAALGDQVLTAVLSDHGGGWTLPAAAAYGEDTAYVLFACGLLADRHPRAARALAATLGSGSVRVWTWSRWLSGVGSRLDPMGADTAPVIEAMGLVKRFGDFTAVDDVSFEVPRGSVFGLLGPNGAGKTTTVRMMTTLALPTSGSARVAGHDVVTEPEAVRASMGLTAQSATVDDLLTGRENLRLIGDLYGLPRKVVRSRTDELLERFSLDEAGDKVVKEYSGGMRRRIDLAVSLIAAPSVLFLDEPTTGLDPRSRVELWEVLRGLVRDGTTLLLTTQYLDEADQLADTIVVIDHGRIIAQGTPLELKDQSGTASLVVTVSRHDQVEQAAALLRGVVVGDVRVDVDARKLHAPGGDVAALASIAARLDEAGIEVDDLGMQRPSLDDVFLALTGHKAQETTTEEVSA